MRNNHEDFYEVWLPPPNMDLPVRSYSSFLTHWGLVTPYGIGDLGQHWRHQAITWTNVDLSSVRSGGIHLRTLS